jgi:Circadian oscillating protein COP23
MQNQKTAKNNRSIEKKVSFRKMMRVSSKISIAIGSATLVSLTAAACSQETTESNQKSDSLEANKTPNHNDVKSDDATSHSARSDTKSFDCKPVEGVNTTVAITPRGDRPVIRWVSTDFDGSGWPPQKRCNEVSEQFQELYANGSLKYLTTGKMNGQRVICSAAKKGGRCNALLLTVRPGRDPQQTLKELLAVRVQAAGSVMNESGERLYIDINSYFN